MAELKQWFKILRCRLTGGHRYKDTGLASYHDPFNERFLFGNRCVKCGHYSTWDVPAEAIFGEVHRRSRFYTPDPMHADIDEIIDGTEG